jgi:phosphoribosyl-AMP cyclohydrolase
VACHTGRRTCFYRAVRGDGFVTIVDVSIDPAGLYRF